MERLRLNYKRCLAAAGGDQNAITQASLDEFEPRLEGAAAAVNSQVALGNLGFAQLPHQDVTRLEAYAEESRATCDSFVVVGIGGSALGTIALATALLPFYYNELDPARREGRPRLYVLDNVDPDETMGLLEHLDLGRTVVNVISKSGTTAESMAGYLILRDRLRAAVGAEQVKHHLVFTTDPESGTLRRIGEAESITMFDVPPRVGGRFSVLSPVGLLPAAMTGIDVQGLLSGAADMAQWIATSHAWDNPALAFAGLMYLEDTRFGRRVSVMMPYSARLKDVADWYRQLWAESLGKAVDRSGATVNVGPLPIKALGVTDQHSQLQLYSEGPDDKVITFLGVDRFEHALNIPQPEAEDKSLAYLGGRSLAELLWAEQKATAWALAQNGRPSLTITVPRVDAFSMGSLLYLLEYATAVAGELYNIDAFDQPGVELSKQATNALMGRPGFEDLAAKID